MLEAVSRDGATDITRGIASKTLVVALNKNTRTAARYPAAARASTDTRDTALARGHVRIHHAMAYMETRQNRDGKGTRVACRARDVHRNRQRARELFLAPDRTDVLVGCCSPRTSVRFYARPAQSSETHADRFSRSCSRPPTTLHFHVLALSWWSSQHDHTQHAAMLLSGSHVAAP